ncbi:SOS response-associated peptidase [Tautonia plasticadhaerens]|uniref:Abasic site processing protein n=1 Tax=Tautonia plasticadhaerens TaxID=2527974 RepID=A0A518H1F6_9BACT|nr:SOS response-associated peptidase [Tautonia plasticadhaerens]QDV34674.1 Putative SOS response-associated peptidase YedK [Tautonia plasticadhaerens]
MPASSLGVPPFAVNVHITLWKAAGKGRTPYYFHLRDDPPFAFAGLWECWSKGPEPIDSVAIITTEPNELVAPVHDRMPVILRPEEFGQWLDPQEQEADLLSLLAPLTAGWMDPYPVGKLIGSPKNDRPECIERAAT